MILPILLTLAVCAIALLGYIVWDLSKRVKTLEDDHFHPTAYGPSGPPIGYKKAVEQLKEGRHLN